jgi:acetolactate synthase I/II/III large subunit
MRSGGQVLGEALARMGVEVLFTLCGGHILPIYEGAQDHGIRVVDVRHEQSAAFAADGWARVTGEPGVAAVTAGPGVCNALTAVVNARNSDVPMVLFGGQAETARQGMGGLQETPHVRILEPVTKWARSCSDPRRLSASVGEAFREATAPRTGPAFLEIPWDVLYAEVGHEDKRTAAEDPPKALGWANPDAVRSAADILAAAERPAVLAGTSLRWSGAPEGLDALARVLRAPVYLNSLARGALRPDHPYFLSLSRGTALEEADVILDLGAPFDFRLGYGEAPTVSADARVLMVDVAMDTIGHNRTVDVGLIGDVGIVAQQLAVSLKALPLHDPSAWLERLRSIESAKRAKIAEGAASASRPVHALRLAKEIDAFADDDTILIGDGGNIVASGSKVIRATGLGNWLDPGRFGCLGVGLPFALAAKIARPEKRVLALLGDGAFGITAMELDTLVRHNVPIVAVIGNDGAWAQIRGPQLGLFGAKRAVATLLGEGTRYDEVAKGLGGYGELVEDPAEIQPAIERAFRSGKPAVVNVLVDPESNVGTGSYAM